MGLLLVSSLFNVQYMALSSTITNNLLPGRAFFESICDIHSTLRARDVATKAQQG
jgi:hypothetical protein